MKSDSKTIFIKMKPHEYKDTIQQQLLLVLIPTLEDHRLRVHSHATAVLINFCEHVEHDTLIPYLDSIVQGLLCLLNPTDDGS